MRRGRGGIAPFLYLACLLGATAACRPPLETPPDKSLAPEELPAAAPEWLRDVTPQSQVDFTYRNGEEADRYTILESLGGGVALFDYDGDGRLDIFFTGGGEFDRPQDAHTRGLPGRLYRNLGEWRFTDVTTESGLAAAPFYSHGCLTGDFDNDGWLDLLVTGLGGMVLYHNRSNDEGGRHFVDVTKETGLTDERWCTSAAWGDLTGNGRADLYVCRYLDWSVSNDPLCPRRDDPKGRDVCPPQRFLPLPHSLYQNNGGTFTDVSARAGLASGKGLGVVLADLNDDGRPDVYVANDDSDNLLYLNQGAGTLAERGMLAGAAADENGRYNGSMGVDVGDFDGEGRCSLFVANYQGELSALYVNLGRGTFLHQSQATGLGAVGQEFVGFGCSFLDLDNDGWLDLVQVNGHVLRYPVGAPFRQRPLLFHNVAHQARRFFREIGPRGGPFFATPTLGRGLAVGDLDNDGWPDVVVSHCNHPVTLLRNVAQETVPAHWIGLELIGRGHRPIAGATVRVEAGGRQLTRFTKSGGSYLSSSDPRILLGLGEAERVDKLTVQWPWGELQQWDVKDMALDQYWRLEEGAPSPQPARAPRQAVGS